MKISLYSRPRHSFNKTELEELLNTLTINSMEFQVNAEFAHQITSLTGYCFAPQEIYSSYCDISPECKVMVSYGGDGTFLGAVRMLECRNIPIIGINSGRLGFLANITKNNMHAAMADIANGMYSTEQRTLLECCSNLLDKEEYPYAFNEVTIQRTGANMIATEIYVNDEMIATCHGDGVLVSTPVGSTAYSLSVGGPIVAPDCNCFVISPIAPHNLTMRPVVVPHHSVISFKVHSRGDDFNISLDNRNHCAPDGTKLEVKKAEKRVFVVCLRNISFYDTLRNKMMWGIDSRDILE